MSVTNEGSLKLYVPQGSISFDGSDDIILCEYDSRLTVTNGVTVTAWINPTHLLGNDNNVFSCGTVGTHYSFLVDNANDNLRLISNNGISINEYSNANCISLNEWQHVAVTYDKSNINFYVNGKNVGSNSCSDIFGVVGYDIQIGGGLSTTYYSGQICEIKVFSGVALTADEIKKLYNGIDVTRNMVAYWKFDEKTGDKIIDEQYSLTGSIVGGTWKDRDIRCWGTRWDESNWGCILETFIDACDRNYLMDNVTPRAVRELYNILGTPKYIDTTFTSSNTLIIEPQGGYGISSLRERRVIGVKNIQDTFITPDVYGIKIECVRLDI